MASGKGDCDLLVRLARSFGTPAYVLDVQRLVANYRAFAAELGAVAARTRVLFSLKTNYLPAAVRPLHAAGAGVDVVSGYELTIALRMGIPGADIVFNGPAKTPDDLAAAVAAGVFVNIDGIEEIGWLAQLARPAGRRLDVGLRVQAGEDLHAAPGAPSRRQYPSKFGWPVDSGDADRILGLINAEPALRLVGIHVHLGSQLTEAARYEAALREVGSWVVRARLAAPIDRVNVGGGFPVPGIRRFTGVAHGLTGVKPLAIADDKVPYPVPGLLDELTTVLRELGLGDLTIIAEPGRAIVSDAMTLISTVASVKELRDGRWVLLDAGLNLLPTAGAAEKHSFECLTGDRAPLATAMVAGPLCYEGDVFGLDIPLPQRIKVGDVVAIRDAGAYSVTRATSFNRLRCKVISVTDDKVELSWRDETVDDILRFAAGGAQESSACQ